LVRFDLADALSGESELLAGLLEGAWEAVVEAEAQLGDLALTGCEGLQDEPSSAT
jgi:hypothetical protein